MTNLSRNRRRPAAGPAIGALLAAALGARALPAHATPPSRSDETPALGVRTIPRIGEVRVQTLDLPSLRAEDGTRLAPPERLAVRVQLDADAVELDLRLHSIRSPGFRVLVSDAPGELREVPSPPLTTYRGTALGHPLSAVTASFRDGRFSARVALSPDGAPYDVQPASDFAGAGLPPGTHVSFRADRVEPHEFRCGVIDEAPPGGEEEGAAPGGAAAGTGLVVCELACDADYYFYQENLSDPAMTVGDIEDVMNSAEFVYERDVAITYEITTIVVRTSLAADPYTLPQSSGFAGSADQLLCEFREEWNAVPFSLAPRDTAQLYTGRTALRNSQNTSVIGLAFTGTVCDVLAVGCGNPAPGSIAYSLVESRFNGGTADERVSLSAHELGHNWSAIHCTGDTCHIMCANIGGVGCGGTTGANLKFGPLSIATITSFRNSRTCLDSLADPQPIPFFDPVAGGLDTSKWSWSHLALASSAATNPPSPPFSILLRSVGSQAYQDAELRSNFILLAGASAPVVSYYTEHVGVEAGKSLTVEYWGGQQEWVEIETLVSDGVDQTQFEFHQYDLPIFALHDEFRVAFRVQGNSTTDRWYVDDVYVGPEPTGACCVGQLCGLLSPADCLLVGGTYQGNDTTCPDACGPPPPTGACCFADGSCFVLTAANCGSAAGTYQGDDTDCGAVSCPLPCPADLDDGGDVGFSDLLVLLAAWGPCAPPCAADLDESGDVGFSDLLVLLAAWGPCE